MIMKSKYYIIDEDMRKKKKILDPKIRSGKKKQKFQDIRLCIFVYNIY